MFHVKSATLSPNGCYLKCELIISDFGDRNVHDIRETIIETHVVLLPFYAVDSQINGSSPVHWQQACLLFTIKRDMLLVQIISFVNVSRGQKLVQRFIQSFGCRHRFLKCSKKPREITFRLILEGIGYILYVS